MSHIGSKSIKILENVVLTMDLNRLHFKGPLGERLHVLPDGVACSYSSNLLTLTCIDESKIALWGLHRALISNKIFGICNGFTRILNIVGVGYRAYLTDNVLVLKVGYSHPIEYMIPDDVRISCPSSVQIVIFGVDKDRVGQIAAEIRSFKKPEPYKGKGIRYENEQLYLKEGKKR